MSKAMMNDESDDNEGRDKYAINKIIEYSMKERIIVIYEAQAPDSLMDSVPLLRVFYSYCFIVLVYLFC